MFSFIIEEFPDSHIKVEYINRLEEKLEFKFPNILKQYYILHNDAETRSFKVKNLEIVEILPLCVSPYSVESILFKNKAVGIISKSFIPFAMDKNERILYWNTEDYKVYIFTRKKSGKATLIAESVNEILY